MVGLVALLFLLLPPLLSREESTHVELSFPLGEHFRVGKYVPVRVSAPPGQGATIRVEADGAVPVELAAGDGAVDALVPMLALTTLGRTKFQTAGGRTGNAGSQLVALGDDQRLVGVTLDAADADDLLAELFPTKRIIRAPLDPTNPLPGPIAAWGALDAVLLDAASAARVDAAQLSGLLAAGTVVAVRDADGLSPPQVGGGWARRGNWWVARVALAGPVGVLAPDAYEPVSGWAPGVSSRHRREIVLILVAFGLAALAASLLPRRYAGVAVAAVSVIACFLLGAWHRNLPISSRATGEIVVSHGGEWRQTDTWVYERWRVSTGQYTRYPTSGLLLPVFSSRRQLADPGVLLKVGPNGRPETFVQAVRPDLTTALLVRDVQNARPPHVPSGPAPAASPLRRLAERLYLRPGDALRAGGPATHPVSAYWPTDPVHWPSVLIERDPPANATRAPPAATAPAGQPR